MSQIIRLCQCQGCTAPATKRLFVRKGRGKPRTAHLCEKHFKEITKPKG